MEYLSVGHSEAAISHSNSSKSHFESLFQPTSPLPAVKSYRVRLVARKRHPLASDLSSLYYRQRNYSLPKSNDIITVIGHTRFATSSINRVSELHPHEFVPFHSENIWLFNSISGKFQKASNTTVGIHITHNGDFDAMTGYSTTMVNRDIGLWLERILHTENNLAGDSPKIAGMMDLLRYFSFIFSCLSSSLLLLFGCFSFLFLRHLVSRCQGRWGCSARLAYVRCILSDPTEVCGGEQLSKSAMNTFPSEEIWNEWERWFDSYWILHLNNIIKVISPDKFDMTKKYHYSIDLDGERQFVKTLHEEVQKYNSQSGTLPPSSSSSSSVLSTSLLTDIKKWSSLQCYAFLHHSIRGFLRNDLYTSLSELLSRAEGSFGIQVHCSIEPGVVVIASKGQPMSISYDPSYPIALFASEAEALAVPIWKSGKWLSTRFDLDSKGEIIRIGERRSLIDGQFGGGLHKKKETRHSMSSSTPSSLHQHNRSKKYDSLIQEENEKQMKLPFLHLDCGIEIRSYSLITCQELSAEAIINRSFPITAAPIPYNPKVDLVANDLRVIPAVVAAIDMGKGCFRFAFNLL
jgi:hypothetical protein